MLKNFTTKSFENIHLRNTIINYQISYNKNILKFSYSCNFSEKTFKNFLISEKKNIISLKLNTNSPLKINQFNILFPHSNNKSKFFYNFGNKNFSSINNEPKNNPNTKSDNLIDPSKEQYKKDIQKTQEEYDSDNEDQVSFYNQRKKMIYIFTSTCLIFIGMYIFLNYVKPEGDVPLQKRLGQVTYIGSAKIGGPWKLFNTKGEVVTHKDLSGKYYLIYFGFTQCPDVCPMSLQKISKTLNKIRQSKEYKYFDMECLFVSVDPDRDSYERIKNYCELFNKNITGLTGKANDDPELKGMLKEFKIHSSKIYLSKEDEEIDKKNLERVAPNVAVAMDKIQPKNNLSYSLDHTIVTYLMGPENNFITYLSANLNYEEMYNIVLEGIMNDLSHKIKGVPIEKANKRL